MAFGLFKKKNRADIIYMNGHIYTQDPGHCRWRRAAACKDGRVMAGSVILRNGGNHRRRYTGC